MIARLAVLAATVVCTFVAAELAVYAAHRWISHAGLLRGVRNDVFRRAHYHHHFGHYPPHALHARAYTASHDLTFVLADASLVLIAVTTSYLFRLETLTAVAMTIGVVVHGAAAAAIHAIAMPRTRACCSGSPALRFER